jgi:hypothetical protein
MHDDISNQNLYFLQILLKRIVLVFSFLIAIFIVFFLLFNKGFDIIFIIFSYLGNVFNTQFYLRDQLLVVFDFFPTQKRYISTSFTTDLGLLICSFGDNLFESIEHNSNDKNL